MCHLSKEHWVHWRVLAVLNIARLGRYAALAVELCRNIKCPLAHTRSVLDVEQGLKAADKWSLDKLLATIGTGDCILAVCIAESCKYIKTLSWISAQVGLICICVGLAIGGVDMYVIGIALLVDNNAVEQLSAEVVEADGHIVVVHRSECLRK